MRQKENFIKYPNISIINIIVCKILFSFCVLINIYSCLKHILAEIYFIFIENCPGLKLKFSNMKFANQWKEWKSTYLVQQVLALFKT